MDLYGGLTTNWNTPSSLDYTERANFQMDDDWGYPHDVGNLPIALNITADCFWLQASFCSRSLSRALAEPHVVLQKNAKRGS